MLKFSIRDLILLTVLVAFGSCWWAQYRKQSAANARLHENLAAARDRLSRAEDLLEYQGILLNENGTTYTTPERARQLREEREPRWAAGAAQPPLR